MLPSFSQSNVANVCMVNPINFCYLSNAHTTAAKLSNFKNLFLIKLCKMLLLTPALPSFFNHVGRVFSICSSKQMVWIYARRVVASVRYNWFFFGKLSSQNCGKSVRPMRPSSQIENSVSLFGLVSSPNPTGVGFLNIAPKSFFIGFGKVVDRFARLCDSFISSLHHIIHGSNCQVQGRLVTFLAPNSFAHIL